MGSLKNPNLQKAVDFFRPLPEETSCLGIALGRQEIGVMETLESPDKIQIRYSEIFPLPVPLWVGVPPPDVLPSLVSVLTPLFQKNENYRILQVSLPDPAARLEVFELEKIPAAGTPLEKFLHWRLCPDGSDKASLVFASQFLGEEKGKKLLLGESLDRAWLQLVSKAFEEAKGRISVMDMSSWFRFNLFHETFRSKGPGALVSLERDYWTLLIWDGQARPRFQRSKWWRGPISEPADLPLGEVVLEAERTIRSYVHSGPDRLVESLFLLVPEAWRNGAIRAFQQPTEGRITGLSLEAVLKIQDSSNPNFSPSLAATAVRR